MDHPTTSSLLTWITFLPLIGAALILPVLALRAAGLLPKAGADQASRVIAFPCLRATLALANQLLRVYDRPNPALQHVQHVKWIPAYNIEYFVGVDGISITLVILSARSASSPPSRRCPGGPATRTSTSTISRSRQCPATWPCSSSSRRGCWRVSCHGHVPLLRLLEVMLLPMYFLIGIWGGAAQGVRGHQVLPLHPDRPRC